MPEMPAPMINTSTCSMLVEFMGVSLALLLGAVAYPLNPLCGITVVGVLTAEDSFLTFQDTVFVGGSREKLLAAKSSVHEA